jgi:hypothetical protein
MFFIDPTALVPRRLYPRQLLPWYCPSPLARHSIPGFPTHSLKPFATERTLLPRPEVYPPYLNRSLGDDLCSGRAEVSICFTERSRIPRACRVSGPFIISRRHLSAGL